MARLGGCRGTPQSKLPPAMATAGDRPAPLTTQEQGMLLKLKRADVVLKARLATDEKFVRRVAKRVAQLARLGSDKERYVAIHA